MKQCDYVNIMVTANTNQNILYPTLYMSALTHAIMNVDEYKHKKWSQVLSKTLDKRNIDQDDLKDAPYKIAQKLLDNPLNRILKQEEQYD